MLARNSFRDRLGAAALGIASLFLLLAQFLHPVTKPNFADDLQGAAEAFASTGFAAADIFFILAFTLLLFGILALYVYLAEGGQERWAFVGVVLSLAGVGLFQTFNGIAAFTFTTAAQMYLAGQKDALNSPLAIVNGPGLLFALVGGLLLALGFIVFALAIWRSSILPKWAALLLALGFVVFLFAPQAPAVIQNAVRVIDGLLFGIGGIWLAWSMLQLAPASRKIQALRSA